MTLPFFFSSSLSPFSASLSVYNYQQISSLWFLSVWSIQFTIQQRSSHPKNDWRQSENDTSVNGLCIYQVLVKRLSCGFAIFAPLEGIHWFSA
jgi:hypothetical protein